VEDYQAILNLALLFKLEAKSLLHYRRLTLYLKT